MVRPRIGSTWRILHNGRVFNVEVEAIEERESGVFVTCLPAKMETGRRPNYRDWPWRGLKVPVSSFTNAATHLRKEQNIERFVAKLTERLEEAKKHLVEVKKQNALSPTANVEYGVGTSGPRMFTVSEILAEK